ncbi:MAG: hypothetical protein CVU42_11970 [Chloroflexi bacterium HGW-Chloroflexi-4]|jgi:hypothetical protein|nr:MAG: hypothetical protein CVU42_11970 [Chloroflexi bacterium HGW-Chloroflexi-4]
MKELIPAIPKKTNRLNSLSELITNPAIKRVLIGLAGAVVIGFSLYSLGAFGTNNSKINYLPSDVVYGEKIVAIHLMGEIPAKASINQPISNPAEEPGIQISENYYDFGLVNSTQVLTRIFVIANTGKSVLIIQRAYTTCGCTKADFTANEIPPGKVVLMTLQFDPNFHEMSGTTVRRGVMIESNDPNHPIQEIWVQATVR